MKIDLHVHCSERSGCGQSTEKEQIEMAIDVGLDAIAFTDHFRLVPPAHLVELNAKYAPFRIFNGIEITIDQEDFIILGIDDLELEKTTWTYLDLHVFVRKRKGYVILAHPFRYRPSLHPAVAILPPDAIEVRSVNTPAAAEGRIREVAANLKLQMICSSDSHNKEIMGTYFNEIDTSPASDLELPSALRAAKIQCCGCGVDSGMAETAQPAVAD